MEKNVEINYESKENNVIYVDKLNYEIQNLEKIYIKEHYNISQIENNNIEKILEKIRLYKKDNISVDNLFWKALHKISTKPGGFISIKNRKEIYSFILDTLSKRAEYKIFSTPVTKEQITSYDTIIKNDCKRSVLYSIIRSNDQFRKYQINKNIEESNNMNSIENSIIDENDENKKTIKIYINELMDFTKESLGNYEYFNYFQGYQEVCLYFMIIFGRKEGVKYMTLFAKIYLEYVLSKKYKINFDMLLDILNNCCNTVNKKANMLINKITKTKPYYSLSWLITYLTHSNDNIFNQLTLLDYFITSNISHIYFLSANIIVSEFNKIGTKFNIQSADEEYICVELFFQHFQKLKISLIDFEKIIKDNEKINHKLFNTIIFYMMKNIKNENDKGTLVLINRNIYNNQIFEYHSVKHKLFYFFIVAIIFIIIIYKRFLN
jgi:hypothetical protein